MTGRWGTDCLMHEVPEVTPRELSLELMGSVPLLLLDVREAEELEISRLAGVVHIPLNDLADRVEELDPNADTVVICRSGGRSAYATAFLLHQGFRRVRNLSGGMNEWARSVDPSVATY